MNAPKFITDPTIVRWFGSSVTILRALICLFSAIVLGLLILLPIPRTLSFLETFITIVAFPFFYVSILGSIGVFTLWLIGWFVSIVITSSITNKGNTFEEFDSRVKIIKEHTINIIILIGTLILVALEASGKLSKTI